MCLGKRLNSLNYQHVDHTDKENQMEEAKIIKVIRTARTEGDGINDTQRIVVKYYSLEGVLMFEDDPFKFDKEKELLNDMDRVLNDIKEEVDDNNELLNIIKKES